MSKFGDELLESVKQMAAIERGEVVPAREIIYDRTSKKMRISICLDPDILEFFKSQASLPNAVPYQVQINNTLRAAMDSASKNKDNLESLADLIAKKVAANLRKSKLSAVTTRKVVSKKAA